jgi:hypothetical protein
MLSIYTASRRSDSFAVIFIIYYIAVKKTAVSGSFFDGNLRRILT